MNTLGIILSGGGARGAYESGVLSYVFKDLARTPGPIQPSIISGTSVGAFNGIALAAYAHDPGLGTSRLQHAWTHLALDDVVQFGVRQAASLPKVLLGGAKPRGIFDAGPLARLVRRLIPWRKLGENIQNGLVRAVTVTATHVATGNPVVFMDLGRDVPLPIGLPPQMIVRRGRILPPHVLASAAIPIAFPPIRIGEDLYCDGGLRLNTPMAPAIRLGARRLLVVGVATPPRHSNTAALPKGRFPGASFLLGKVLNAFLLDHVLNDLEELERMNAVLEDSCEVGGSDLVERLNELAMSKGHPARRVVQSLLIRPSVDLGRIAGDYLHRNRARFGRVLGRSFFRMLELGEGAESDLASYILFDGDFARTLVELGRADAAARRDEIASFLYDDPKPTS